MAQTVLVADDNIASQRLFEMVLKQGGYDVITVGSGAEVLKRVKEKRPDVALIDAVMPEIDSYQLCRTIKQDPQLKNLPIIMLAGTYEDVDREQGAKVVGANALLDKPANSQAILSKVKELLALQMQVPQAEKKGKTSPATAAPKVADKPIAPKLAAKPVPPKAEVVQEPSFVEEEYEFEEDSEEVDLAVESEILDEEAEWEEETEEEMGEAAEVVEEIAEAEVAEEPEEEMLVEAAKEPAAPREVVAAAPTPRPEKAKAPEARPAARARVAPAPKPLALAEEQLDTVAAEIARRVAEKLVPAFVQSVSAYLFQIPSVQQIVEQMSRNLVQEILPDIQETVQKQ